MRYVYPSLLWVVLLSCTLLVSRAGARSVRSKSSEICFDKVRDLVARAELSYKLRQDLGAMAKGFLEQKAYDDAYIHYRAVLHFDPSDPANWYNVGLVASDLAYGSMPEDLFARLTESKADKLNRRFVTAVTAYEMALYLGFDAEIVNKRISSAKVHFAQIFGKNKCISALKCSLYNLQVDNMQYVLGLKKKWHVGDLCKHANTRGKYGLRVHFEPDDIASGIVSLSTLRWAYVTLRVCGVALFPKVLRDVNFDGEGGLLKAQAAVGVKELEMISQTTNVENISNWMITEKPGYSSRSDRRIEVKLPLRAPFTNPALINNPVLDSVTNVFLSDQKVIDAFSLVASYPGAEIMKWETDTEPIFPSKKIGEKGEKLLTRLPVGFTVIAPFDDFTVGKSGSGPTEFALRTHIMSDTEKSTSVSDINDRDAENKAADTIVLTAKVKDTIVFDTRIWHRGTTNAGKKRRAMLYMTYVRPWFQNVPKLAKLKPMHTADWDELDLPAKQMFSRIDTAALSKTLSDELTLRDRLGCDGPCPSATTFAETTPVTELVSQY